MKGRDWAQFRKQKQKELKRKEEEEVAAIRKNRDKKQRAEAVSAIRFYERTDFESIAIGRIRL